MQDYMRDYAAITDIKERQLAFLDDAANFYGQNPAKLRGKDSNGFCSYVPISESPGCAIGRTLPRELTKTLRGNTAAIIYQEAEVFPKWMNKMGGHFLDRCQSFHDRDENWKDNKLSFEGINRLREIKVEFGLYV